MLRIVEFEPVATAGGALYRPRLYGDARRDRWDGYIVFFPIGAGTVVSTPLETTQPTIEDLRRWSLGLDAVYFVRALASALETSRGVALPATLTELEMAEAETLAARDAIALHDVADRASVAASETGRAVASDARRAQTPKAKRSGRKPSTPSRKKRS
jgi:hypothetical protein